MRRLEREPLSESAAARLRGRTDQIRESASELTTSAEQLQARKEEAKRLWDQEKAVAFEEIEERLKRMAPGDEHCMYCESGEGSNLDHFYPRAKYPERTYEWRNYLWACSVCNSNYKRDQFPLDDSGQPLLINPVEEDPRDHLDLSPKTGKYLGRTLKGDESIRIFGLGRGPLERSRQHAWMSVQSHIETYARRCQEDDHEAVLEMQRVVCRSPHASVFEALIQILDTDAAHLFIRPACIAAIHAHPEIRGWV